MKLSDWARGQGVDYKTAYRWFRAGQLPVSSKQLPTGTILVEPSVALRGGTALYARVSSVDQKADLDRQISRLIEYATKSEHSVTKTVKEIGSGLNGRWPKLIRLLRDAQVQTVIVEQTK